MVIKIEVTVKVKIDNLPNEEWKDIPGYTGLYMVSNMGRIFSFTSCKILNTYYDKTRNFMCVRLFKDGGSSNKRLARLVYNTFVSNTSTIVRYRDGNTMNCKLSNLYSLPPSSQRSYYTKKTHNNHYKYKVGDQIFNWVILDRRSKELDFKCKDCGCHFTITTNTLHTCLRRNTYADGGCYSCKSRSYKYHVGDIVNGFKILEIPRGSHRWKVQCLSCGEITTKFKDSIIKSSRKCCNACAHSGPYSNSCIHDTYVARKYQQILKRCYKAKNDSEKANYQDKIMAYNKGVRMCRIWLEHPNMFEYWYIKELDLFKKSYPNDYKEWKSSTKGKHVPSMDRIDPNGDYAPWNLRIIPLWLNSKLSHVSRGALLTGLRGKIKYKANFKRYKYKRDKWYDDAFKGGEINEELYRFKNMGID